MAAAKDAGPILERGEIASGLHVVVDRLGSTERDVPAGPLSGDEPPSPPASHGRSVLPDQGSLAFVFHVFMKALAEEERVTGAVGNILQPNATADEDDAIL